MNKLPFSAYDIFGYVISGLIILATIQVVTDAVQIYGIKLEVFEQLLMLIAAYVTGHLVASPSKAIIEDRFVHRVLGSPTKILMNNSTTNEPLNFFFKGYFKPLPESQREKVIQKIDDDSILSDSESLFLHVRYSNDIRSDEKIQDRLSSFLILYGFSRNLAFTFLFCGLAMIVAIVFASIVIPKTYVIGALVFGIGFLYRYLKFFRQYSFEMLNSYGSK